MEIIRDIEVLQGEIRNYMVMDINNRVLSIMERMIGSIGNSMSASEIEAFNHILEELFKSVQNRDYQLLDDLIEFELKPFYKTILNMKERS